MSELDLKVDSREIRRYFTALSGYLAQATVTSASGEPLDMTEAVNQIMGLARRTHAAGNKLIFIGNGGSSAIASHMATDYSTNGDVRAMALNDTSMLTCLGNDLGYDRVFAKQIELYACADDLVEIGHLTICHAILDFICGLRVPEGMLPAAATAA